MPFCTCCGNDLNEDANFCPNCGARVRAMDAHDPFAPPTDGAFSPEPPDTPAPQAMPYLLEEVPEPASPARHCILAAVLCILLALFLSAMCALGALHCASRGQYLAEFVRNCDLSSLPADVLINNAAQDENLAEWLLRTLTRLDPAWEAMDERAFSRYLDAYIKPFVAEQIAAFAADIDAGRVQERITKKELTNLLESSRDYLASEFGIVLSSESIARTVSWLAECGVTDYADLKYWDWQYPALLGTVRLMTSRALFALGCLLSVLCICLLGASMHSARHALCLAGGTMSVIGSAAAIACLCSAFPLDAWLRIVPNASLALLVQQLLRAGIPCAVGIALAGFGLLIVCAILARIRRKSAR